MKAFLIIISLALLSSVSQAVVMNSVCTTAKGTQLLLTYENDTPKGAQLISLTIGGVDMRPRLLNNRFGTTGGKPTFTLTNFPLAGKSSYFTIYNAGSNYSVNGQANPLNCSTKPAVAPAAEENPNAW